MLRATTACTFSMSLLPKEVRSWCAFYILTWKCASRRNGVHFFALSTSEWCVLYILTWKCASRHNHFFNSSTSKLVRSWCALYILTSKCASRHNGVQFFSWPAGSAPAALARLLFDLRSHKSLEKHSESRLSYLFAHLHLLSSDFLCLLSSRFLTSPP